MTTLKDILAELNGLSDESFESVLAFIRAAKQSQNSLPMIKPNLVSSDPSLIVIYTDGACIGNPGAGGYGVVILAGEERVELSGGFRLTTNNRMEMMGAIVALNQVPPRSKVTLYSDSQYVVNAITKGWAKKWKANGWKRNAKEKAVNPDLWEQMLTSCDQHTVDFRWVKGHAGNLENERCDQLAVKAAQGVNLPPDPGYRRE